MTVPDKEPNDAPTTATPTEEQAAEVQPAEVSARRAIPGRAWAIVVAAALLTGAAGYFAGQHNSTTSYALATGGVVAPGTETAGPTSGADGTFDATIYGSGAPLTAGADITAVHRRNPADPFAVGALDAPVVISEFSDTECPYCARYTNETESQIITRFVDTGLVRIEWNDMPINGPLAVEGAKAGRAAAEQGRFQEFKKELYANHPATGGHPEFTIDDYVAFAETAGVTDIDLFRRHATDDTFTASVDAAQAYGQEIGITGTPAFVVGTQFVSGAQPYASFEKAILGELAVLGDSGDN
ncbi:DsbA family protein [Corynebacterium pacaense]|uniref:DsbA family protein n=1 Tax=Corynebacterium pacaense TaxID=1816684 RepID=UPI0009BA20EC|nr:thioredoxin domain-containing protein [Corynebacterium pacaense]